MAATYYKLRGMDVPKDVPQWLANLAIYKHWREGGVYAACDTRDIHETFFHAVRFKFPNGVQILTEEEWGRHRWCEEHVHDYCHEDRIITIGGAACGKSNDAGLILLCDWLVDPLETVVLMVSTSVPALLKRTFESTVRYYRMIKRKGLALPGKVSATAKAIILDEQEGSEGTVYKYGIHGMAVEKGDVSKGVGNIRGTHARYVRFLVDELNVAVPAVVEQQLLINLATGADNFKFLASTNWDSFTDLAGINAVPEKGWRSIDIKTESWRTDRGWFVRRHDGLKSPAMTEPDGAKKWPYLLTSKTYGEMLKAARGNPDDPSIMRMVRAWPPAEGGYPVVVTPRESVEWGFQDALRVEWRGTPTPVAGLDPAYGGDQCVLQLAWAGFLADGRTAIVFEPEPRYVPISGAQDAPTVTRQIVDFVLPVLRQAGVQPQNFAIDDSGPQTLADDFAEKWSNALLRCSFGGKASELRVSAFNPALGEEVYANQGTENAFFFREYGKFMQIYRVPAAVIRQLTSRRLLSRGGKHLLIAKEDFKKETKQSSPDEGDAAGMCLRVVRLRVGLVPGASEFTPQGPMEAALPERQANWSEAAVRDLNNFLPSYAAENYETR